jgi:predicted RNA binding protein YcfA (HicA-like mRNA interferase family)
MWVLTMSLFRRQAKKERRGRGSIPKTLNQQKAKKLLEAFGWTQTLGGKHNVKMEKPGCRPITLPMHKGRDYSPDLRSQILRQAGIRDEE